MDLPFNCELALYKKYSYRLAVHEHSWEVFPVHHDSEHCIIAPVGVKWLVRGSGMPRPGWVCKSLHRAQCVASNKAPPPFEVVGE